MGINIAIDIITNTDMLILISIIMVMDMAIQMMINKNTIFKNP